MIAWRIVKAAYANRNSLLDGSGAEACGGRWNRPGVAMVYASESSSLALLETMVHASLRVLPALVAVELRIPDNARIRDISLEELHERWRNAGDRECVELGTQWLIDERELILRVPSAVNPLERNVLINPAHNACAAIEIGTIAPIVFDSRLVALIKTS